MVISLAAAPIPARAQGPVAPELDNHAFRYVLSQFGLSPVASFEALVAAPERTILIVFGRTKPREPVPIRLGRFVQAGGAVLIASDRTVANSLLRDFEISIQDYFIRLDAGEASYGDSVDCVPVRPGSAAATAGLFETSRPIVTNRPSYLQVGPRLPVLAWLPAGCERYKADRAGIVRSRLPLAAGGDGGKGRLLVLADHSIFINGMMLPRELDNGNIEFAYNCVKWLKDGKRDRALFIDEGRIETSFEVPIQTLPDLPIPPGQLANLVIAAAEKENLINRFILELFGEQQVRRSWIIGLTVAFLVYGIYRLMYAGHTTETKMPLISHTLDPADLSMEQRYENLLANDNLREAAQALAHDVLLAVGFKGETARSAGPPRVQVRGGWWQRQLLSRSVRRFWNLAHCAPIRPVSRRQFGRLLSRARQVRAAAEQGILSIEGHL
jgi:hypothetical protein